MKRFLLLALFIAFTLSCFSQKEGNKWYFGEMAGVDFNSGSPVSLSGSEINTNEGCASIADRTTGQLLFYTDGETVYNKNNSVMTNGTGLLGNYSTTQSAVIIPQPGSNTLYYIFTADAQVGYYSGNDGKFCYSIVDMSQNGGLGTVTVKNKVLAASMTEKIAAYRHCNGHDIWVVAHQWNSSAFYAYLVTSAGISAPVISNSGTVHEAKGSGVNAEAIGYMKISPDGTMLGVACDYNLHLVEVFPFNNSSGIVGGPILSDNNTWTGTSSSGGPYGLTFSPDSRLLYVTVEGGFNVYQYNLKAGNSAAILSSKLQVGKRKKPGNLGALQIAIDGKIYIAETATQALGVINNPDSLGLACNFVESAVPLSGTSSYGLPDMVENFVTPLYMANLAYTSCSSTNTLSFIDTMLNGNIKCLWNFGDTATGASDTSSLQNPTHAFSTSGNFKVTLQLANNCGSDTFTNIIHVPDFNSVAVSPKDTTICIGSSIQLRASGGEVYQWSPQEGLNNAAVANPVATPNTTTTYSVSVSPVPCGDSIATVRIIIPSMPVPKIIQSHDTLFTSVDSLYTTYQWYFNDSPLQGAVNSFCILSKSGNYTCLVTDKHGCIIAASSNIITGVQNYFSDNTVHFFPNPATNEVTLFASSVYSNEEITLSIINILGEKLFVKTFLLEEGKGETINIANLSAGVYIIQVANEKGKWIGKLVKSSEHQGY